MIAEMLNVLWMVVCLVSLRFWCIVVKFFVTVRQATLSGIFRCIASLYSLQKVLQQLLSAVFPQSKSVTHFSLGIIMMSQTLYPLKIR